jgi:gliding motility-associated-like protein
VTNANGCQSAVSVATAVSVNTLPLTPTITPGGPTTFCDGSSVTLSSSAGSTYLWSNGANTASINITASGSYSVQVTNASGCQSALTPPVVVIVNALPATPTISSGGPTTFCDGDKVTLTSSAEAGYLWSNSATSQSINVTTAGSYTVQVTNASGCQSASSVATIVTVNPLPGIPTVTTDGPTTFCEGDTVTLTSSVGISYLWSNGETFQSIPVSTAGTYTVKVTNESGCLSSASGSVTIVVNTLPVVTTGNNGPVCTGSALNLIGSPAGMKVYYWSGPDEFSSLLQNPIVTDSATLDMAGTYTLIVANADGCTNTATQNIVVNAAPVAVAGPDQDLKFTFNTQMNAELSLSETGEWSLISGSGKIDDIHSPTSIVNNLSIGENKFIWKVLNGKCEDTSEVKIIVYDVFVPSVITPNGDGKNDDFKISEFSGKVELIIFNRWGNEEYRSENYINDWNGRNNKGVELPNDTYFYILKFENGRVLKGSVFIKR